MAPPTKLYTISSLLMATLFAVSASFQLNDPDWFFWIPLYACGSAVNLLGCSPTSKLSARTIRRMARFSLWLGIFLFVKVVVETLAGDEGAGFWSLDMRESCEGEIGKWVGVCFHDLAVGCFVAIDIHHKISMSEDASSTA